MSYYGFPQASYGSAYSQGYPSQGYASQGYPSYSGVRENPVHAASELGTPGRIILRHDLLFQISAAAAYPMSGQVASYGAGYGTGYPVILLLLLLDKFTERLISGQRQGLRAPVRHYSY